MTRVALLLLGVFATRVFAHQIATVGPSDSAGDPIQAHARYLANAGVMVVAGQKKVLFDPFFATNFGIYQVVPEGERRAVMSGEPPYNNISAVFISHAHADHFDASAVTTYLQRHPAVRLFAPQQAVSKMALDETPQTLQERVTGIRLSFGDNAWLRAEKGLALDAVRIPHAGWPGRAEIENLLFRVSFSDQTTVIHLGDADVDINHYLPYRAHWQSKVTHWAFPPYWFYYSMEGRDILSEVIKAQHSTGMHVPITVPGFLKRESHDYFHQSGETRVIPIGASAK